MATYQLGVLVVLSLGLASISTSRDPARITPEQLSKSMDSGAAPTILDVRSAREFAAGHVPGAMHIPFLEIRARLADGLIDTERALVVYCGHGPRAYWARSSLRRLGHDRVILLEGHFRRWRKEELPIEK